MNRRLLSGLFAFFLLLVGAQRAQAQFDAGIPVGSRAPAPVINDLDGTPVDLGTVIGKKPVLVEFWATWCPICAELFPKIQAAHARYGDRVQFLVVAVAVNETPRSIKSHLTSHPLPFPVLWDTNGNAVRAFQAPGTSFVVLLDGKGKVAYTGYGADQDIDAAVRRLGG